MYIHLWEYCPQAQYRIIILQDLKKFSHSFGTTLVLLESPSDLFGTIFSNCEQTLLILFSKFLDKIFTKTSLSFLTRLSAIECLGEMYLQWGQG